MIFAIKTKTTAPMLPKFITEKISPSNSTAVRIVVHCATSLSQPTEAKKLVPIELMPIGIAVKVPTDIINPI